MCDAVEEAEPDDERWRLLTFCNCMTDSGVPILLAGSSESSRVYSPRQIPESTDARLLSVPLCERAGTSSAAGGLGASTRTGRGRDMTGCTDLRSGCLAGRLGTYVGFAMPLDGA